VNYVKYAEDILGVHVPHSEAMALLPEHGRLTHEKAEAQASIRTMKMRIEDRTAELQIEETANNPSMSATALKEHMRVAAVTDPTLTAFRDELAELEGKRDALAGELQHVEMELRTHSARMVELGGLLNFYAANKHHEAEKQETPET